MLPSFAKTPRDLTVRVGATARLECAAEGHPAPQMAWQKDGGTDFPAARERRMHVMPDDDVFFITDVKPEDAGVYSCTARNSAGTASANATLSVLGKDTTPPAHYSHSLPHLPWGSHTGLATLTLKSLQPWSAWGCSGSLCKRLTRVRSLQGVRNLVWIKSVC